MNSYKLSKLTILIAMLTGGSAAYADSQAKIEKADRDMMVTSQEQGESEFKDDTMINDEFLGPEAETVERKELTGREANSSSTDGSQSASSEQELSTSGSDSRGSSTQAHGLGEANAAGGSGAPLMVHFEFDSAELTQSAKEKLQPAVDQLRNEQRPIVVDVAGFTDDIGPEEYNEDLAERRAEAVKEYFTSENVEVQDWELRAPGEDQPVASNDDSQGRQENRRVEIQLANEPEELGSL